MLSLDPLQFVGIPDYANFADVVAIDFNRNDQDRFMIDAHNGGGLAVDLGNLGLIAGRQKAG
jgi:hypothetical protein